MRFMSLIVALCFSMNVFASTGSIQALEAHLDDYNYALSVEWDQKDPAFYEAKTKIFFDKLGKLIQEDGLTQAQIMKLVELKMNNKAAVEAMKLKFSLLAKGTSVEELARIVKESSKDFYAQGASWNGSVIVPVVVIGLFVAVIGYSVWFSATHECVAYEQQYVCNTYNNCHGGYYGGGYDPYYGGGYYGGGYCYGSGVTTCGYENVCTEYAKKD